jgi:hypothetical protein
MLLEIVKETTANSSTSWVFTTYDISVSYVVDGELLGVVDVFEEKSPAFSSKLADEGYYFVAGVTCDEIVNAPGPRYSILGVPENIGRPRRSLRQWLKTRRSTSDDMMEVTRVSDAVISVIKQLALSLCSSHDVKMLKKHRCLVEPSQHVLPRQLVDDQLVARIFGRRPNLFLYIGGELGRWLNHRMPDDRLGDRLPRYLWSDLIDQVSLTIQKEVDPILARIRAEEELKSLDSSALAPCSNPEEVEQQRQERQLCEVASLCGETPEELVARHLLSDEARRRRLY